MQGASDSRQVIETGDDVEGYTLTSSFDTQLGNQGISIFGMLSKSDYIDDADSFSTMVGLSGFFPSGDRSTLIILIHFQIQKETIIHLTQQQMSQML